MTRVEKRPSVRKDVQEVTVSLKFSDVDTRQGNVVIHRYLGSPVACIRIGEVSDGYIKEFISEALELATRDTKWNKENLPLFGYQNREDDRWVPGKCNLNLWYGEGDIQCLFAGHFTDWCPSFITSLLEAFRSFRSPERWFRVVPEDIQFGRKSASVSDRMRERIPDWLIEDNEPNPRW